jgi:cell division septum initiation protein DivIVA
MSTKFNPAEVRIGLPQIFLLLAGLAGCAGNPPIDAIANADTAVNQAMTVQASEYAPAELQHALDKVSRAKQAMADKDYEKARRLAEQAQADAQVAEAKARSETSKRMAQEARKTIDTLRREAETQGGGTTGSGTF